MAVPMSDPSPPDKKPDPPADRVHLIQAIRTPLGFFALVVLVVEAIFGVVAAATADASQRDEIIYAMIALIFLLVLLVAVLAVFRPEALRGERYAYTGQKPSQARSSTREFIGLASAVLHLRNKNSGRFLDVTNWELQDGTRIQQFDWHGGANQAWRVAHAESGYFYIVSDHSGKCLTVADNRQDDDAPVVQWERFEGLNQQWKFYRLDDGSFIIAARHSGKALTVQDASPDNNASVVQKHSPQGDCQRWWLQIGSLAQGDVPVT